MNVKNFAVVLIFILNFCQCLKKRYDNYSLYQALPLRFSHLNFLRNLQDHGYLDVHFWRKPSRLYREVQFFANVNETEQLIERMQHFGVPYEILVNNLQKEFDKQTVKTYERSGSENFTWDHYHGLEDIYHWLREICRDYSSIADLEVVGKSAEHRDIYSVVLRRNKELTKPKVVIEAGIHGHEWMSPMFATYVIHQLIHNTRVEFPTLSELASAYDWYIIPVANPDGFLYTHTEDRLWRKNRRHTRANNIGVDLNRNFDYSFGLHDTSKDPADEFYCGPVPFSEPETKALANYITKLGKDLTFYFSIHCYGQMIILPYSDRINRKQGYHEMENIAQQASIRMYHFSGHKYTVGSSYDTFGKRCSGDSVSWVKTNFQPKFASTFVLRDYGIKGFALSPEEILPTCKESLIGVIEMMTAKQKVLRSDMYSYRAHNHGSSKMQTIYMILLVLILEH